MAVTVVRKPAIGFSSNIGTTAIQDYKQMTDDNVHRSRFGWRYLMILIKLRFIKE